MEKEAAEREKAASTPEKRLEQAAVLRSEAVTAITDVFSRVEATGKVDVVRAEQTVSSLVSELLRNGDSLLNLVQLKDADAYTYTHSVNVSILSMYLALNTKYQKYVEAIGTGALLHDIGKVRIPPEVLRKDGPLDESERRMIRQHPEFGAQLLLDSGCCADITLSCVLDHHEKATGCGYPRGKRDTDISPFARITCLADIYDALTTDRPYRKAMSPRDAVLLMSRQMRSDLDPLFLNRLIAAVGCFTEVGAAQSNKNAGLTAPSQPIKKPHRPVVQAVRSYTGIDTRC
jgi:putative nucleotidyltransferase with HDIG domain